MISEEEINKQIVADNTAEPKVQGLADLKPAPRGEEAILRLMSTCSAADMPIVHALTSINFFIKDELTFLAQLSDFFGPPVKLVEGVEYSQKSRLGVSLNDLIEIMQKIFTQQQLFCDYLNNTISLMGLADYGNKLQDLMKYMINHTSPYCIIHQELKNYCDTAEKRCEAEYARKDWYSIFVAPISRRNLANFWLKRAKSDFENCPNTSQNRLAIMAMTNIVSKVQPALLESFHLRDDTPSLQHSSLTNSPAQDDPNIVSRTRLST